MAPPAGAALEIVTVHVVVEDAARLVLAHTKEVKVIGAVTVSVAGLLVPLKAAVRVTV